MIKKLIARSRFIHWNRILSILLAVALLTPLVVMAPAPQVASRVQPILLQMVAERPETTARVIVQKSVDDTSVEDLVARLGGEVTKDLHIINAFAAELPAKAVPALARATGVRWVSLDAPVTPSQAGDTVVFTTWATEFGTVGPASNAVAFEFNDAPIAAGNTIWFSSIIKADHLGSDPVTIRFEGAKIQFTANGSDFELEVPDGVIIFSPTATLATTIFDVESSTWVTTVPPAVYDKETFLAGLAFPVTSDLPARIKPVAWSGHFETDTPGVTVEWKWAAAVYSDCSTDYSVLGVKPVKSDKVNPYLNSDNAGTPENFKPYLIKGASGKGGSEYTGSYCSWQKGVYGFTNARAMIDEVGLGPDGVLGYASGVQDSFAGFDEEITPGYAISQVEAVLPSYVLTSFDKEVKFKVYVGGSKVGEVKVRSTIFSDVIGPENAGTVVVDLTNSHNWQWSDFANDLELLIEHRDFKADQDHFVYYDAIGLRVTSAPGTDPSGDGTSAPEDLPNEAIDTGQLVTVFPFAIRATDVWNEGPEYLQGEGVTVVVLDSGIGKSKDLGKRNLKSINFNQGYHDSKDRYGHGTFVASVIAGDGTHSRGEYIGIAPKSNLLNVRVSDDEGMSYESDLVAALQWVYENKDEYDIRAINLSLNSSVAQSYHTSPLCVAVEILWFNGIVVVVPAGNNGTDDLYPPANDPYVITVGATDDGGTLDLADDVVASFSAYGMTESGLVKPELVAPGKDIAAYLPRNNKLNMVRDHKSNQIDNNYFRMSGTSVSAPMVSGAVALLLQDEPDLTPDQVKYRLTATANRNWPGYDAEKAGAGYLDIYAAVHGNTTDSANTGTMPNLLLAKMALMAIWASNNGGDSIDWDSVNWNSVNWNSVNWNSVNWNSVNWNSVNWNSVNWDAINWDSVNWNSVNWNSVNWNSVNWNSVNWNSVNWNAVNWNSDHWDD